MKSFFKIFLCLQLYSFLSLADSDRLEFKAQVYERNLETNALILDGKAWVSQGGKQVWADRIEVDTDSGQAIANGHVHIIDAGNHIHADHASYALNGDSALFDNATLSTGSMVISGKTMRKINRKQYEVEEGFYTNCNISQSHSSQLSSCKYAWKLYGNLFSVTLEDYAHVQDAVVYLGNAPVFYTPYFILPIKTKRESGFLPFNLSNIANFGTGFTLPYFWATSEWQDFTFYPTYYTEVGWHLRTEYRYVYSSRTQGKLWTTLMERRFGDNRLLPNLNSDNRTLGILGDSALYLDNRIGLGERSHTQQKLRLVSDPYFIVQYSPDLEISSDVTHLKNFVSYTLPMDRTLLTAKVAYDQNLIMTVDSGVDGGPVAELPEVRYSLTTTPLFSKWLSFHFNSRFTHFYRPTSFDRLDQNKSKDSFILQSDHTEPLRDFRQGDYIRTGTRLMVTPSLVTQVPMPEGFQLQPALSGGTLLYHFTHPNSTMTHQEYLDLEVPLSLYASKNFDIDSKNTKKINHVFQPRILYGVRLLKNESDHPFFFEDRAREISSPRFDFFDRLVPYEYMRLELINRFRRLSQEGEVSRFLLLQISEQINFKTTPEDVRYAKKIGPLELRLEFGLGEFTGQIEAKYQFESTLAPNGLTRKHEWDWSSSFGYRHADRDYLLLNNRFRMRANVEQQEQYVSLNWAKTLPLFFDLHGLVEYNFQRGQLGAYELGFTFGEKPVSCWDINVRLGRNTARELYATFDFRLNFGTPGLVL